LISVAVTMARENKDSGGLRGLVGAAFVVVALLGAPSSAMFAADAQSHAQRALSLFNTAKQFQWSLRTPRYSITGVWRSPSWTDTTRPLLTSIRRFRWSPAMRGFTTLVEEFR
jgi:hypothetical protein